jgi:hypothetical protein
VLIGTNAGVWVYSVSESSLELLASSGPVLDLALSRDGTVQAIIMQAGAPLTARHFAWGGGASAWQPVSEEFVMRLAEIGPSIAAFDPDSNPDGVRWLAFGESGQRGLRALPSGIESTIDAGRTWVPVRQGAASRLVVAPDFDDSGVGLATLFPDLVVRTADGGETWKAVATMPGRSGGRVFFAGATQAFIALAGSATWQEF